MVMQSIDDGCETDISKIQLLWTRSAHCVSLPCSMVITSPDDHLHDADGCCILGLIHWYRQAEMWVINWRRRSNTRRKEKQTHLEQPAPLFRFLSEWNIYYPIGFIILIIQRSLFFNLVDHGKIFNLKLSRESIEQIHSFIQKKGETTGVLEQAPTAATGR